MIDRKKAAHDFIRTRANWTGALYDHTELVRDLGLDGELAFDFIDDFFKEFSVDPGGFKFSDHFSEEFNLLTPLILVLHAVRWIITGKVETRVPISVGMLLQCAERGRWSSGQNSSDT